MDRFGTTVKEDAAERTRNRGKLTNIHPSDKYLLSACHLPGKGGGAGNPAVD